MDAFNVQFEGCLFNEKEIRNELNITNEVKTDASQMLAGLYQRYGVELVKHIRGEFVFSVLDKVKDTIYLFRDRVGVRTIYYTTVNGLLVYSSSIEKILQYQGVKSVLDREGACELLGLGPARTPGKTPFRGIHELLPGSYLIFNQWGIQIKNYWKLETKEHTENLEETVYNAREMFNTILDEETEGISPAFLLSGGLDSSYVSAVWKKKHISIDTYSLDYPNSANYFKANSYQPELDRPYVDTMVKHLGANHNYVFCSVEKQLEGLNEAMIAHSLPCMVDIQSTLDYFCKEIAKEHSVIVTGECADEIFGGYPWFHVKELVQKEGFCWAPNVKIREILLRDDTKEKLKILDYVNICYEDAIKYVEYLDDENEEERLLRRNAYLTIHYFMQTLVRRTVVSCGMSKIEARVPFADPEFVEYVYNIPWSMKKKDGCRKYILRQMAIPYLPEEIVYRPKSPYPKNPDPAYGRSLCQLWKEEVKKDRPIFELIDKTKLCRALEEENDFEAPWFGQLMRKPQMLAYFWQLNEWLNRYQVDIDF